MNLSDQIHALRRGVPWHAAALATAIGLCLAGVAAADSPPAKPRIAVFSGPTATIQNNKPLITSNKAREKYGLPLRKDVWGHVLMDWPRYQRLAAPVTVYIEMYTAHPLEADVKELYAPPDGYVWVRYGPDAVLIDEDTGEIVQGECQGRVFQDQEESER